MGCRASTQSAVGDITHHYHHRTLTSPSSSLATSSKSDTSTAQEQESDTISRNFILIWLYAKVDESSGDYRNSIEHLRRTVHTITTFHDIDECVNYISKLENEKVLLIISGALCESVVPRIHNMDQLYSIFVFCWKQSMYEEWAKNWSKVKGIFTDLTLMDNSIQQSARYCDEESIEISAVSSLNQIEPSFMYTKLFKESILEINFDEKKEINALTEYAREKYAGNNYHLPLIDKFAHDYCGNVDNKPLWWYSEECFTYRMVNKALGNLEVEVLLKMIFFIRDLTKNIDKLHSKQMENMQNDSTKTITVYRGKTMRENDFQNKIKEGGLLSFNNFLSTSTNREKAIEFIQYSSDSEKKTKVLFTMIIDHLTSSGSFVYMDKFSRIPSEKEILFSTHTVFRVLRMEEIKESDITLWEVKLTLTSDSDDMQLNAITGKMREKIAAAGYGWARIGDLLHRLGENVKAEQIYMRLLDQPSDEENEGRIYNNLGAVKTVQGEYTKSIEYLEKALKIFETTLPSNHPYIGSPYSNLGSVYSIMGDRAKALLFYEKSLEFSIITLPPNHPELAPVYSNIGTTYYEMGEYPKALSFHEKSMAIIEKTLTSNHPELASAYSNIGIVYFCMGEYSKALSLYQKSVDIKEKILPSNHPDLATPYNNIGSLYDNMGEYSKAYSIYEKTIDIQEKTLPPNHPSLATSYNNIGSVYVHMGEYSKALSFHEKSRDITEKTLGPHHPSLATSYTNIGCVYVGMGEYSKGLSFHEKALGIQEKTLGSNHIVLATSYNNIGDVYDTMGEYLKALSFHEKSLGIREKTLSSDHPDLATSYSKIGSVYLVMGEYSKALSFYEKALGIEEKILGLHHLVLATTYNNIGAVYDKMGECSKALEWYEKSLDVRDKTLPSNHPSLAVSYNNIGSVYENMSEYSKACSFYEKALDIREKICLHVIPRWLLPTGTLVMCMFVWASTQKHFLFMKNRSTSKKKFCLPTIPI